MRMTPEQAAEWLLNVSRELPKAFKRCERENLQIALGMAHRASSGTVSYAQMRREDRPYAKRHGTPLRDPSLINKHQGGFDSAWRMGQAGWTMANPISKLSNASRVADYLGQGTKYMFRRPIADRIIMQMRPIRERRLIEVTRRVLGQQQ